MNLTAIILLSACLAASATGNTQGITLKVKNKPLQEVFTELQKQSGYNFVYTGQVLQNAGTVTLDIKNSSLEEAVKLCLKGKLLSYTVVDKIVVVKPKVPSADSGIENEAAIINIPAAPLSIELKGKVTDSTGVPLSGASVRVKGSSEGTSTNAEGVFSLNVTEDDLIVISYIGYQIKEVKITPSLTASGVLMVILQQDVSNLNEVIINKGYYSTSRKLNTGSVTKITAADIQNQPVSNPIAALQGRVPGLIINQRTGLPGTNFTVQLRGQSSIQSGNSPLFIIDGVPFLNDQDVLTQRSSISANSPFNTINPADIESIEILKDADATAIYGSRGANGVILINTVKRNSSKTGLSVNFSKGWGKVTRSARFMNTEQYLQMRHEAFANDGVPPNLSNAYDLLAWDTTRYTDWNKLLIGKTSQTTNANIRFHGGNTNTSFSLGANYFKETTVFPGDNYVDRKSIDLNVSHNSDNKKFSALVVINYGNSNSNLIPEDITGYIKLQPNAPEPYTSSGKLNWSENGFSFYNPLSPLLKTYNVVTDRITGSATLGYKIIDKLTIKSRIGYNKVGVDETTLNPISSLDPSTNPKGSAFFGKREIKSWIIEPQLEYNNTIVKNLDFQALLGGTWQETENGSIAIDATGYTNDNLIRSTVGAGAITSKYQFSEYKYQAFFGRINFNWKSKYVLNATARRDGSSRFGPNKQFSNFGAVGIGWVFSGESFIGQSLPFITYGKLRGSYGVTGNDQIGDYQYLDNYGGTTRLYQNIPSLLPLRLLNPNYTWERNKKLEFGLELGGFNDRIYLGVNYYRNRSDNQLISYPLPGQAGFTSVIQNFPGLVQNKGWEFELKCSFIKSKQITWTTSINLTIPENKLISFPGLESSSYSTRYVEGKTLNSFLGYKYLGVDPQTGIYQFADKNGHSTSSPVYPTDLVYLGTTDPEYFGGIQNSISFKGLEFDFLIEYRKQLGLEPILSTVNIVGSGQYNQPVLVLDRWQKAGDVATYQKYTQASFGSPASSAAFIVYSTNAALTDASFLRLRNLSLSYDFKNRGLKKMRMSSFKIYLQAQNLFTVTNYNGADPENQSLLVLPPLRMIATGIKVNF